jgi:hypothetical protein
VGTSRDLKNTLNRRIPHCKNSGLKICRFVFKIAHIYSPTAHVLRDFEAGLSRILDMDFWEFVF